MFDQTLSHLVSEAYLEKKLSHDLPGLCVIRPASGSAKIVTGIIVVIIGKTMHYYSQNGFDFVIPIFLIIAVYFLSFLSIHIKRLSRSAAWIVAIGGEKLWVNVRSPFFKNLGGHRHPILEIDKSNILNMAIITTPSGDYSFLAIELNQPLSAQIAQIISKEQKWHMSSWPKTSQIVLTDDSRVVFCSWKNSTLFYACAPDMRKRHEALMSYPTDYEIEDSALSDLRAKHHFLKRNKNSFLFKYVPLLMPVRGRP